MLSPIERGQQEALHDAIQEALEGKVLTGWVIAYEYLEEDVCAAGHFYGPSGMTTWRALGLTEWISRTTLVPSDSDDDDESDEDR